MNRTYLKAAALAFATIAGTGAASAQDWVGTCIDPASTTSPYSTDYGLEYNVDDLFGCVMGVSGTVNFSKYCFTTGGITLPTAGRIGFLIGGQGSTQDVVIEGKQIDDFLSLTFGGASGPSGNTGYGTVIRQEGTAAATRAGFGSSGFAGYYFGQSDRYFVVEGQTSNNVYVQLRVDVIGDAARLDWLLTNLGAQANVGLDFGQWVAFNGPQGLAAANFVNVPGFRPLSTNHRFVRNPDLNARNPRQYPLPPYVDFGITQSWAYGLHVPCDADSSIPDQTPIDALDIGSAQRLLGSIRSTTMSMPSFDAQGGIIDDVTFFVNEPGDTLLVPYHVAYVQRWFPSAVAQNATREIVGYYKSTSGYSDFQRPYSTVIDGPRVVAVADDVNGDPLAFNPPADTPATTRTNIRVYVDNTRGFSTIDQAVAMNSVRVTLALPQGMTHPDGSTSKTITINRIDPQTIGFADFPVLIDDNLFGVQNYTVTVAPNPGPVHTITGSVNVASQARLQIRAAANLVTAPWTFTDNTWSTILNTDPTNPLVQDQDFQAFGWDAEQQQYVIQSGPARSAGSFIVSTKDVGFRPLGGKPRTPSDLASGAPLINLKPGWNLIANPYNYAITIGQIVGVAEADNQTTYRFEELVSQKLISGSLAYWDTNTQSYKFTSGTTDTLIPNRGYWIYVTSPQDVALSMPPVYQPFVPQGTGGIRAKQFGWKFNLVAKTSGAVDDQNVLGTASSSDVADLQRMKPPVSPTRYAVSGGFVQQIGSRSVQLAQAPQVSAGKMQWNWQVFTRSAGPAQISWPSVSQVPSNVKLTLVDVQAGKSIDMRKESLLTFVAKAQSNRTFTIVAETNVVNTAPVLGTVSAGQLKPGKDVPFTVSYQLTTPAKTTVQVLSGTKVVATLLNGRSDAAGTRTVDWNCRDSSGKKVARGVYTVQVTASATDRATETKSTAIFVIN